MHLTVFLLQRFKNVLLKIFLHTMCGGGGGGGGGVRVYVSPTAMVIRRQDLDLKSHPKEC